MVKTIIDEIKALYKSGKYEDARKRYSDFYNANPKIDKNILNTLVAECTTWLETQPIPELFHLRGLVYWSLKQYEKALEDSNKAIELKPDDPIAYYNRGNAYWGLKQYPKAIKNYNKAIALKPDYADSYNNRGSTYWELKDYEKAIEDYNKAIELNPDEAITYNNRGNAYWGLKQYPKAIENYSKAIELNPDEAITYSNRGTAYSDLKDYEKAIEDYIRYSQLENDEFWKEWALREIEELSQELNLTEINTLQDAIDAIKDLLKFKGGLITHYTNMAGAKALLTNAESSFRLSEANYMNDTSEGEKLKTAISVNENYNVENKIVFTKKPFLGSFVAHDKCNDLTLWRMYAKTRNIDGHGCAITLNSKDFLVEIRHTLTKSENTSESLPEQEEKAGKLRISFKNAMDDGPSTDLDNEFCFYEVAYLDNNGKCIGMENKKSNELNKAIETIKRSIEKIKKKKNNEEAMQIALERLSKIEYLFKGEEYRYENEIRLVLSKTVNNKHIKVDHDEIFDIPWVYIEIGNLLPALHAVTIGPKVEKAKEWASVFNYTFQKEEIKEVKIEISKLPYK